ncbi:MAG: penicillin-binding protein 2 [Chloroflexi bacterium]|nr:penicillin-binding protein 2 [Chloroflexota bacterium]
MPEQAEPTARLLGEQATSETSEALERQRWRMWFIGICFGLLTCLVVARLLEYQIIEWGATTVEAATAYELAPRGVVVDRDGELLAADRYFYRVSATPKHIRTDQARKQVADELEILTGLPASQTFNILLNNSDREFVEIAKTITLAQGQKLLDFQTKERTEKGFSSLDYIDLTSIPQRYYPQASIGSHLLGFVQADGRGAYGLEEYYDSFLNANSGVGLLGKTTDKLDVLSPAVRRFVPSMADKDLVLTLDRTVQWIIEEELRNGVAQYRAQGGSIIVMQPKTGAILGMANWPDYDPNNFGVGNVNFERFSNPSISALYEPGSIFKLITMAAALDTNLIEPETIFTDTGYITIGDRIIYNSSRTAAGRVTVSEALAQSLNVVTAQVALRVGSEQFYRYVRRFGFGELTKVDLAGELPGLLKTPGNEMWSQSDLGTNSFGQGLAVTPLQMVSAVAAIANGGQLMRPYIVQARVHDGQVLETKPINVHSVMKPEAAQALTKMMIYVVDHGNSAANVSGYRIAGKSGTAQIPTKGGYLENEVTASFIGFGPVEDPQFVMLVKLDRPDPRITEWANFNAAPMFAQIARRLFDHLNVPPDTVKQVISEASKTAAP